MTHKALTTLLALALPAGVIALSTNAHAQPARDECNRLIDVLEKETPSRAYGTLEKMRIYRRGSHYQACVLTGRSQRSHGSSRVAAGWSRLPPDKQDRIRDYIRRRGIAPMRSGNNISVGETLPLTVPLRGLPRDMVTEIPKVTSYRYVVLRNGIAIVEPDTRTVVQIISR